MRTFHEETLADLWHKTIQDSLVFVTRADLDRVTGLSTGLYDCLLVADSMQFELDLGKDLWLTEYRFNRLKRDYLPERSDVDDFINRCSKIVKKDSKRGVVTQLTCRVHGERGGNYQWGNCMMGFTFRGGGFKRQPVIALHSRASNLSDIGALDLALAWVFARDIAKAAGGMFTVEDIGFRWFSDSLSFHGMKGLAYVHSQGLLEDVEDTEEFPSPEYPQLRNMRRLLKLLRERKDLPIEEAAKFGPMKRLHMRWRKHEAGELPQPSRPLDTLRLEIPT